MKYIRTKDGRIINCRFSKQEYERDYPNSKVSYERWFELAFKTDTNYEILKQADTIEELCDEFVVEDRDDFAIFHNLKWAKQTKGIIYGAIWNEWGLKYVAKMNDKGELELI